MVLNLANLNEALDVVKHDIVAKGYNDSIVADAAADYEVSPQLLVRKFAEKYGKLPQDYRVIDVAAQDEVLVLRAKKLADEYSKMFTGSCDFLGKVFTYEGHVKLVTVAWTTQGLHCIQVIDGKRCTISFSNREYAARWIAANLR